MLDIKLRTPSLRPAVFVRRLMSHVLTRIFEHERFSRSAVVRGSMSITRELVIDTELRTLAIPLIKQRHQYSNTPGHFPEGVSFFPRRYAPFPAGVKSREQGLTKTAEEVRHSSGGVYFSLCVLFFAWSLVQHISLDVTWCSRFSG
jgi:hypothetical protein